MNEDRLSTLLAERAGGACGVHPTMAGVEAVVAHRSGRRRRQRILGGAAAALAVVVGLGAALALSGGGEGSSPVIQDPAPPLPDVPTVGLQVDGFVQGAPQIGDLDLEDKPARTVVVFRGGRSLADPFVTVSVKPPAPDDFVGSLDLDGDGLGDANLGGSHLGIGIDWRLADGSAVTVGGELTNGQESEDALIAYAREVFGPTLDLDELPAPAGFPERDRWTLPDPRGTTEARVSYEGGEGNGRRITVSATNQPGWFEVLQDLTSTAPAPGYGFEEVALGPSFLGPGRAIVAEAEGLGRYALIRTDAGLTIEIDATVEARVLRDIIESGAFVDIDAEDSSEPTTTTAPGSRSDGSRLPEVQSVDLDIGGLPAARVETGALDLEGGRPRTVAVFRDGGSLTGRYFSVAVEPPVDGAAGEVIGNPIDLDGDGADDAGIGGNETGLGIIWRLDGGALAIAAPEGELDATSEEAAVSYAGEIFGPTIDLEALPAPPDLSEREVWTVPDPRGPEQALVSHGAVAVTTTNQPGWFDLRQGVTPFCCGAGPYEEVPLGASFLGAGEAIVRDGSATGSPDGSYALIRTDTGLTVEVDAPGVALDVLRDAIGNGDFVEVPD